MVSAAGVSATDCTTSVTNGGTFANDRVNACAPVADITATSMIGSSGDNHASPQGVAIGVAGKPANVNIALPGSPVSATDSVVPACATARLGIVTYAIVAG